MADDGLVLNAFTAQPATPSADALRLLASWDSPVRAAVEDRQP